MTPETAGKADAAPPLQNGSPMPRSTMNAYLIREYGPAARFQAAEVPVPAPDAGELLIEVKATSLNPVDNLFLRQDVGMNPELPAVLHGDMAGVVARLGEGVDDFEVGDEVYACAGGFQGHGGALAEYMIADARLVARKPRSLDFAEASALPLVAITAWEGLLERARLQPGNHVLIHGGTGGVGHVAIQIAKHRDARVATTVSSKDKAEVARDLGADEIIYYKDESVAAYVERLTHGRGFDIVYDTVGGKNLARSFAATRHKGQVINIAPLNMTHDLTAAFFHSLTLHIENMSLPLVTGVGREEQGEILRRIATLVDEGKLRPLLDERRFSLAQANEAHALYESGDFMGKIVLTAS